MLYSKIFLIRSILYQYCITLGISSKLGFKDLFAWVKDYTFEELGGHDFFETFQVSNFSPIIGHMIKIEYFLY